MFTVAFIFRPLPAQDASQPSDSVEKIGGPVSPPVVISSANPEFSEQARKERISGNVLIYLQIEKDGTRSHLKVLRGIGYGLDEEALDAVSHYRFSPAMKDGHPVRVEMRVQVNFQVYRYGQKQ